jgi:hypothetical protein
MFFTFHVLLFFTFLFLFRDNLSCLPIPVVSCDTRYVHVSGGDQGRLLDEADMFVPALDTSLLQNQGAQAVHRKRREGKTSFVIVGQQFSKYLCQSLRVKQD